MSELNNNDPLEELFRSKTGQYDITYREEDWEALKKRLDAADAQRTSHNKRWLAAAAVLILFSLLGYFTYQNYQQITSLNEQLSQTEQTTDALPQDQTQEQKPNTATTKSEDTPQTTDNSERQEDIDNPTTSDNTGTLATADDPDNRDASSTSSNIEAANKEVSAVSRNPVNHLAISQLDCENCQLATLDSSEPANPMAMNLLGSEPNRTLFAAALPPQPKDGSSNAPSPVTRDHPKTSLGFVLGPDLSTVGAVSNFYNPGYKIGLTADFNIGKNFAISVGAIRSDVRYKANGLQYQFSSQGYGNATVQTNQTVGKCILIDIPIQLTYQFLHFDHSRLYASAGFSSYIMLNEEYQFDFNSNQQGYPQRWQGDTGTTHFFSNANISVGYEFDVSRNLSLRAEPFLKMPLKEVGRANVNLYSVGSLISINYHLY